MGTIGVTSKTSPAIPADTYSSLHQVLLPAANLIVPQVTFTMMEGTVYPLILGSQRKEQTVTNQLIFSNIVIAAVSSLGNAYYYMNIFAFGAALTTFTVPALMYNIISAVMCAIQLISVGRKGWETPKLKNELMDLIVDLRQKARKGGRSSIDDRYIEEDRQVATKLLKQIVKEKKNLFDLHDSLTNEVKLHQSMESTTVQEEASEKQRIAQLDQLVEKMPHKTGDEKLKLLAVLGSLKGIHNYSDTPSTPFEKALRTKCKKLIKLMASKGIQHTNISGSEMLHDMNEPPTPVIYLSSGASKSSAAHGPLVAAAA